MPKDKQPLLTHCSGLPVGNRSAFEADIGARAVLVRFVLQKQTLPLGDRTSEEGQTPHF